MPEGDPQLAVANAGIEPGADTDSASEGPRDAPQERTRDSVDRGRLDQRGDTGGPTTDATREPEEEAEPETTDDPGSAEAPLPVGSGEGRRVVFSESQQRVWLVEDDGTVVRTYLASGSVYDNLDPGTYEVFSTSRYAVGIDDSGTMEYFVRFTHGDEGAAIGFHTIPVDDGVPVQTRDQLGTPLSHGCIRQAEADAIALWDFAPVGTTVVVTP
nr:L,D-transpeptidase [Nocardioides thalensis]